MPGWQNPEPASGGFTDPFQLTSAEDLGFRITRLPAPDLISCLTISAKGRNFSAMNLKRWFAGACLGLMLVADFFLFRAIHERDTAQADLRESQQQLKAAQADIEAMKNSAVGVQASEYSRLRKQNEILTNRLAAAQAELDRAQAENRRTAQQLSTARAALGLQQEHLQQLQGEKQQLAAAGVAVIHQNTCIANLHQLDAAKQQWALEKTKSDADVPVLQDLLPYLKDGAFPICPEGGIYSINAVGELPGCSHPGHVMTQ